MSYTSGTGSFASRLPYGQSQAPVDQGAHSTAAWNSSPRPSMPLPPVPQPGKPSLPAYSAPVESASPPPYREPEQPYYEASLQQPQHSQALSQPQPQAQPYSEVTWLQSQPQSQPQQLSLSAQRELQARMKVEKEKTVKFLMNVLSGGRSKVTEIVERIPVTDPSKLENLREVLKLFEWDKRGDRVIPFSWSKETVSSLGHSHSRWEAGHVDAITTKDQRLSMRALILYTISEVDRDFIRSDKSSKWSALNKFRFIIKFLSKEIRCLCVSGLESYLKAAADDVTRYPNSLTDRIKYDFARKVVPYLVEEISKIRAAGKGRE